MRNLSLPHLVFGLVILAGYVFVEARGTVFMGTDSRPSAVWLSRSGRSSWGYSTGHFGGK